MLKDLKRIFSDKKKLDAELRKAALFFLYFIAVFTLLISIVLYVLPLRAFEFFIAQQTGLFLSSFQGIASTVLMQENAVLVLEGKQKIVFSFLCTGLFETALIVSLILGSFGIKWRKRIIGAVLAVIAVQLFNFLRIIITINSIISQSIETAELVHDVFFRISLLFALALIYYIWFSWAGNTEITRFAVGK